MEACARKRAQKRPTQILRTSTQGCCGTCTETSSRRAPHACARLLGVGLEDDAAEGDAVERPEDDVGARLRKRIWRVNRWGAGRARLIEGPGCCAKLSAGRVNWLGVGVHIAAPLRIADVLSIQCSSSEAHLDKAFDALLPYN
eukprot:2818520-Pleurochrysis_carterae.AAC.3